MAYIVPSDLSRLCLSGVHNAEIKVLQTLKTELPNDFTVFHGIHWSREYASWTHFGEIDFVVLNRAGQVLCIEQKNGRLIETDDGLVKRYGVKSKNVAQQIHRSIDKVREKFNRTHGKTQRLEVDYLLYCPDYRVRQLNAAGLSQDRVVDAGAQDGLAGRIQTILGKGEKTPGEWYDKVNAFFYQTFDLVPDIHTHIGSQERQFVRQSGALADILMHLEMAPFRIRISGTAGSGKSLFARRYVDREATDSRKILLVCYNRPLAERLSESIGNAGRVNTFYGFCDAFLQSVGQKLDFTSMKSDPEFWSRAQERIMAQAIIDEWKFDTLIVDEGQDFEPEWFEILRLFLRERANILWLEDSDQNLYKKRPVTLDGFVGYRCRTNYRSPELIAGFINRTLPMSFEQGNHLPGLGVTVHGYTEASEQLKMAGKIVQDLMREGFLHEDIIVLTCKGVQHSIFSDADRVGGLDLCRFTGRYDRDGGQVMTPGKLAFESVYRFKGQERPAVILVDVDPEPDREKIEQLESVLYCGMTRATVRLDLVVNSDNDYNRRFMDASGQ